MRDDTRGGSRLRRGEWKQRNFPRDVGLLAAAAGFGFRAEQSRGRLMLGTYAVSEAAAAAEAAAESCDGGIDPAQVLLIWVVR